MTRARRRSSAPVSRRPARRTARRDGYRRQRRSRGGFPLTGTLECGILAFASPALRMLHPSGFVCFAALALVVSGAVTAQPATGELPPRLKLSPTLEPPPLKSSQVIALPTERDAIFLRADRLEGIGQKWIEATGKVELRTRRQTVLADWLHYDVESDEMWGKGNVTIRRGIDVITGPEAKFKRDTEVGFFTAPEFRVGENASRGSAREILFNGPDHYDIKDASYTTCVVGSDEWYLRAADVDIDRSRLVGTANDATIYFKGAPIFYSPWLSFPLSNERKSGFLTPVFGSTSIRGFEASLPYYLNLAPNYDATLTPPYFREPQILAMLNPVDWKGFEFAGNGEFVRFRQPALMTASRSLFYPTVSWTRRGNAWFVTARTGLHMTHYDLEDSIAEDTHLSRVLPITSVDSGLVFERDADLFGRSFVQTLEPRAYYVYIPHRRQDQIPAFDTAIDDFNFSQLFTENRYLGNDRIGDANQVTLAATTRLLDPVSGEERLRAAIGQRYYFENQRVTLTEAPRTANTSDVLLTVESKLSDFWTAAGTYEVNVNHKQTQELDLGVRWQPEAGKVLNASYRYLRQQVDPSGNVTQLKQVDLSGQWPVGNWSVIGRWNYSLVDGKTLEGVLGLEYNGGCWAFRIVGQRLTTTTQQASSSVFVQFELNGLARLGTNPIDVLKRSVPGYLTVNDPSVQPTPGAAAGYFPEF